MESTITKWLSEGGEVLMKVNKPGTGQVSQLLDTLRKDGATPENFRLMTPFAPDFKENAERVVNHGAKYVVLDFDFPLSPDVVEGMKKTIEVAKEAGLQVITIVKTPQSGFGVQNSDMNYFSTTEQLFSSLEHYSTTKDSLMDNVIGIIKDARGKAGFGSVAEDNKPKLK